MPNRRAEPFHHAPVDQKYLLISALALLLNAMGRTRTKKDVAAPPPAPPKLLPSIPSLLEKSQTLIVQCDYELAKRFLSRIFEQQPAHAEAKEMLGVVQLETGDLFSAKEVCILLTLPGQH